MMSPTTTHEVVEAGILDALNRIKEDGVTPEEVRRAQNQIKSQEAFGRDGPYSVASQLNEAIAAGDWRLYTTYFERIQAVTPADVQRVARSYLVDDARTVGHYVPL
jgi:zinc protease